MSLFQIEPRIRLSNHSAILERCSELVGKIDGPTFTERILETAHKLETRDIGLRLNILTLRLKLSEEKSIRVPFRLILNVRDDEV